MGTYQELADTIKAVKGNFDDLTVNSPTKVINLNGTNNLSFFRDEQQTSGNGTITDTESEYRVRKNGSGYASLRSANRGVYQPGTTSRVGIGARIPDTSLSGDDEIIWGYFENEAGTETVRNAIVFGVDADGLFVKVVRGSTEIHKTYQENWNGEQQYDLDLTDGNIYQITFNYYGYGLIAWQRVLADQYRDEQVKQDTETLHVFGPTGQTSLTNTNLQVGATINGTSADDRSIYVAGRQYSIEGNFSPRTNLASETRINVDHGAGETPLMTMRRKASNRETNISLFSFVVASSTDAIIRLYVGTSLTGASFGDLTGFSPSETSVEVDTSATSFTGGEKVFSQQVQAGGGNKKGTPINAQELPQSIPDEENVTLAIQTDRSGTNDHTLRLREER